MLGFTDLGDVSNTLDNFERQCKGESNDTTDKVAIHMLAFMVRENFSGLEFPYAHFLTKGATGKELFPIVWDGVRNLESGLRVMVITCDGASPNRKFFKMHTTSKQTGTVTYKTKNPYSPDGREVCSCQMCHILSRQLAIAGQIRLCTATSELFVLVTSRKIIFYKLMIIII